MIHLSALLYDPLGHVMLDDLPSSELDAITRRVGRAQTLGGGVSITDGGHSAGDRTFLVRWKVRSESELRKVQRMVRMYTMLTVSTREGVFSAAPRSIRTRSGQGELDLLVKEQLA